MKFNNTITIEGIIGIITLFTTFVTIRQVQKQRLDANMPYVIMDFSGDHDYIYSIEKYDNKVSLSDEFDFIIKNIGNGIAKDVRVSIDFMQLELLESLNIDLFNKFMYFKSPKNINLNREIRNYRVERDVKKYFPYIENNSCKDIKNIILLYHNVINNYILTLIEKECIYKLLNNDINPKLLIKISYLDIFNKAYTNNFEISIQPHILTRDSKALRCIKKVNFMIKLNRI